MYKKVIMKSITEILPSRLCLPEPVITVTQTPFFDEENFSTQFDKKDESSLIAFSSLNPCKSIEETTLVLIFFGSFFRAPLAMAKGFKLGRGATDFYNLCS